MAITARSPAFQSEVCPSSRRAISSIPGGAERSAGSLAARADIAKQIDGRELVLFASKQVAELILAIAALLALTLTALARKHSPSPGRPCILMLVSFGKAMFVAWCVWIGTLVVAQ